MITYAASHIFVAVVFAAIIYGIATWSERIDAGDKRWILNHDGKTFRRPGEEDPYYAK